jgi:hypothetical protein
VGSRKSRGFRRRPHPAWTRPSSPQSEGPTLGWVWPAYFRQDSLDNRIASRGHKWKRPRPRATKHAKLPFEHCFRSVQTRFHHLAPDLKRGRRLGRAQALDFPQHIHQAMGVGRSSIARSSRPRNSLVAVSAITMAELAAGLHATTDPAERARRDRLQRPRPRSSRCRWMRRWLSCTPRSPSAPLAGRPRY